MICFCFDFMMTTITSHDSYSNFGASGLLNFLSAKNSNFKKLKLKLLAYVRVF